MANLAGIVIRDRQPDRFLVVHRALFSARHDDALDLRDGEILAKVLDGAGVDADWVKAEIDSGWPLETYEAEHTDAVARFGVFGVPTFIIGERAVFVRLMDRPTPGERSTAIDRLLDLIDGWPELNEFKHATLDH
jgi:2-hydroxychromene-2-carboxylate isomerase